MAETIGDFLGRVGKTPAGTDVDPEVLLGLVNDRLEAICRSTPWTRLEKQGTLQTVALYDTGTVDIVAGELTGVGTSTVFTSAMSGRRFRIGGASETYVFTYVSATDFTIDRPFEGDTDADDANYQLWQPVYELAADVAEIRSLRNPETGMDLEPESREYLNRVAASRYEIDTPRFYVPAEDSTGERPQIELYPAPEEAVGLPMEYRALPPLFSATNPDTSEQFPDWVSIPCVYAGVMADLHEMHDQPSQQVRAEMRFQTLLRDMQGEDARRRPPSRTNIADRYTAHRVERAFRGRTARNWNGNETGTWGDQ